jgi:hypothetical protein
MLAVLLKVRQQLAYVFGVRHRLAGNIKDNVASLDAVLRGRSPGIDSRNGDALVTSTADVFRRGEGEAESRRTVVPCDLLVGASASLASVRLLTTFGIELAQSRGEKIGLHKKHGAIGRPKRKRS